MDKRLNEIEASELIVEIKAALQDVFVATVTDAAYGLQLRFPNGQLFRLFVEAA